MAVPAVLVKELGEHTAIRFIADQKFRAQVMEAVDNLLERSSVRLREVLEKERTGGWGRRIGIDGSEPTDSNSSSHGPQNDLLALRAQLLFAAVTGNESRVESLVRSMPSNQLSMALPGDADRKLFVESLAGYGMTQCLSDLAKRDGRFSIPGEALESAFSTALRNGQAESAETLKGLAQGRSDVDLDEVERTTPVMSRDERAIAASAWGAQMALQNAELSDLIKEVNGVFTAAGSDQAGITGMAAPIATGGLSSFADSRMMRSTTLEQLATVHTFVMASASSQAAMDKEERQKLLDSFSPVLGLE